MASFPGVYLNVYGQLKYFSQSVTNTNFDLRPTFDLKSQTPQWNTLSGAIYYEWTIVIW